MVSAVVKLHNLQVMTRHPIVVVDDDIVAF
jgi:hypothetical protein